MSTMAVVYNVGEDNDENAQTRNLAQVMLRTAQARRISRLLRRSRLSHSWSFTFLALQCVSTVAVVRRETNSWKWPIFQWVYMGALAWVFAFVTWHGGHFLGFK